MMFTTTITSVPVYHHVYHVNKKRLKLPFPESNEFVVNVVMYIVVYPPLCGYSLDIPLPYLPLTEHPLLH